MVASNYDPTIDFPPQKLAYNMVKTAFDLIINAEKLPKLNNLELYCIEWTEYDRSDPTWRADPRGDGHSLVSNLEYLENNIIKMMENNYAGADLYSKPEKIRIITVGKEMYEKVMSGNYLRSYKRSREIEAKKDG